MTRILEKIKNASSFLILPHKNADGDCLGSAFALKLVLRKLDKAAFVLCEDEALPQNIMGLLHGVDSNNIHSSYDVIIVVDCSDTKRLGERQDIFNKTDLTICLDHHSSNEKYASLNYVDATAAATGEIIYTLCQELGVELDSEIASNLYLAISSDTGCFRQANTTAKTMEIAGKLIEAGAKNFEINKNLFARTSVKVALMREALNSLEYFCDGKGTVALITQEQLNKCNGKDSDCDGIVSMTKNIVGVEVSVFLRERVENVKASLRSNDIDVAALCQKFGGGGHLRAAGCEFDIPIEDVKRIIIKEVSNELNKF